MVISARYRYCDRLMSSLPSKASPDCCHLTATYGIHFLESRKSLDPKPRASILAGSDDAPPAQHLAGSFMHPAFATCTTAELINHLHYWSILSNRLISWERSILLGTKQKSTALSCIASLAPRRRCALVRVFCKLT